MGPDTAIKFALQSRAMTSPDHLGGITNMITDWIGRHDVLLPIREANKASIERLTIFKTSFMNAEKPSSLLNKVHRNSARKMARTVQLQAWRVQLSN